MDLWGRPSNPPEAIETVAAQGFATPIQRRLSATDTDELIAAYRAGATINELAHRYRLHRTTIAATLDRHHVERHHSHTAWTSETLAAAADLYTSGLSLAAVAADTASTPKPPPTDSTEPESPPDHDADGHPNR